MLVLLLCFAFLLVSHPKAAGYNKAKVNSCVRASLCRPSESLVERSYSTIRSIYCLFRSVYICTRSI